MGGAGAGTRIGRLPIAVVGLRLRGVGDIIGHVQSHEDVPLFVEHCEAAVAEVDVTRR